MKRIKYLFFILILNSCGYKLPPSPFVPPSKTQIDEEIDSRTNEQKRLKEKRNEAK